MQPYHSWMTGQDAYAHNYGDPSAYAPASRSSCPTTCVRSCYNRYSPGTDAFMECQAQCTRGYQAYMAEDTKALVQLNNSSSSLRDDPNWKREAIHYIFMGIALVFIAALLFAHFHGL